MAITVEFSIEDDAWEETLPWLRELALVAAEKALAAIGLEGRDVEVSVLLCDDERISELNESFRGKAAPTNVLSWPAFSLAPPAPGETPPPPPGDMLGDIAFARETLESEARAQHLTTDCHFAHLFIHGLLHLLGYDHETDADADLMEGAERRALAAMGIKDPYAAEAGE